MKKQILATMLALFAIATTAGAQVEINDTNFPDENFRAYVKKNFDTDKDNSLSPTEIAAVKDIYVFESGITDLKGIEHFTALEGLYCQDNQLTSLNLSKNTALTELYCYNNKIDASAMQTLVNSLPKVTETADLYAVDMASGIEKNVITMAQVATAKGKNWTVYDNNESSPREYAGVLPIDATNFPDANFRNYLLAKDYGKDGYLTDAEIAAVKEIYVGEKGISNLKGIEYFTALKDLQCHKNNLTELDVSKNTFLDLLYCSYNQLTSLDVSKNTVLRYLYCDDNQLTSLDVSKNTKLTELLCFRNQIKGDKMQALVESLPTVTNGYFCVIDTKDSSEGNVCTKPQVTIAKGKGWKVYGYNGGSSQEYAGSDPSPVEVLEADAQPQNARWYTIDGKRLNGEPTEKGVYIIKGKKVKK